MDFFQYQELARKKSAVLVLYFCAAVVTIVAAVYLATAGILLCANDSRVSSRDLADPQLIAPIVLGTVLLIFAGSSYKLRQLRGGGGRAVATMLGGRHVNPSTRDLDERVLLNVVEEMAIASGMTVPPVYLLEDEHGINAFAAGSSPGDAVIGVTRGALERLTREELQGVIAHEFSHVLNGDMRLNFRLVGVLHGILLIALIGYGILRSFRHVRTTRSKKGGGVLGVILALGVAFLVIGWIGVFFGRLIRSAVSRQREFLADASAVQFTRNPSGLAGALKRVGGTGSRIEDESAEQVSHMFFGNALRAGFLGLMSTHPPLVERIRRLEPGFDGKFPSPTRVKRAREIEGDEPKAPARGSAAAESTTEGMLEFARAAAVASVGTLEPGKVEFAAELVGSLPERLREAVHDPLGAVASVYGLLLDHDAAVREKQMRELAAHAAHGPRQELDRLLPLIDALGSEQRLPLAGMTLPALWQMSVGQHQEFAAVVERLVAADERVSAFEQVLQRMLTRNLAPRFPRPTPERARWSSPDLGALLPECACVLSMIAHAGNDDGAEAARAFARGAKELGLESENPVLRPREQCGRKPLDLALARLATARPEVKRRLLSAAAACIDTDGRTTVEEGELLRAVAGALDCPMPPLARTASESRVASGA